MKTHLTFTLLLLFGFSSMAQSSTFDSIEDAIAIKPSLTLIDFSDQSFAISNYSFSFNSYTYSQNTPKQRNAFHMSPSTTEIMKDDFVVFSHQDLKKNLNSITLYLALPAKVKACLRMQNQKNALNVTGVVK